MKKRIKQIIGILLLIMILSIYTVSYADVGSFDRYDSGSSWGSSDWESSSSGWDWGDDYSYGSSSSDIDLSFLIGFLLGSRPRKNYNINNFNYINFSI